MTAVAAVTGLVKRFGGFTAVDGVGLTVAPGEVVGLLGANGAGKTTVIRCLLGLTAPTDGTVSLFGGPPARDRLRRVGYLPQGLGLYPDLTVAENLDFRRGIFSAPASTTDLPEQAVVGDLPLGWQRRAAFAAALVHRPGLLVLDEPTSGVGVLARSRLWDTIREAAEGGAGVLVTTHHLEEAEQCDRLVMMAAGRVVAAGTLDDVIAGRTAVAAGPGATADLLSACTAAGLTASPAGALVRVTGAGAAAVAAALAAAGVDAPIHTVPATLEEAFVDLVRR